MKLVEEHSQSLDAFFADPSKRYYISEGSTRSSKTYTIIQKLILMALESTEKIEIVVGRAEGTTVGLTAFKDFLDMLAEDNLESHFRINKTLKTATMANGTMFTFLGMMEPRKLKGVKSDYLFIDEALDVTREAFDQLCMRCSTKVLTAFNPGVYEHWLYDMIGDDNVTYMHSTFELNPFLDKLQVDGILALKDRADQYEWIVYGLGQRARRQDAILQNVKVIEFFPEHVYEWKCYGLDWGFGQDPMALVEVRCYENKLYVRTLVYETGLQVVSDDPKLETLLTCMEELGIDKNTDISCDASRPESVAALRVAGYQAYSRPPNLKVVNSFQTLQAYADIFTTSSDPFLKEAQSLIWKKDARGNQVSPLKPHGDDHSVDATRYSVAHKVQSINTVVDQHNGRNGVVRQSRAARALKERDFYRQQKNKRRGR